MFFHIDLFEMNRYDRSALDMIAIRTCLEQFFANFADLRSDLAEDLASAGA